MERFIEFYAIAELSKDECKKENIKIFPPQSGSPDCFMNEMVVGMPFFMEFCKNPAGFLRTHKCAIYNFSESVSRILQFDPNYEASQSASAKMDITNVYKIVYRISEELFVMILVAIDKNILMYIVDNEENTREQVEKLSEISTAKFIAFADDNKLFFETAYNKYDKMIKEKLELFRGKDVILNKVKVLANEYAKSLKNS